MLSTFTQTIEKFENLLARIELLTTLGDVDAIDRELDVLRSYRTCYYCVRYRTLLDGRAPGCCDRCPVHKFGEKWQGRPRAYNGCYSVPAYHDMVRLATLFSRQKDVRMLGHLIDAIRAVISLLRIYEPELHVQDGGATIQ